MRVRKRRSSIFEMKLRLEMGR